MYSQYGNPSSLCQTGDRAGNMYWWKNQLLLWIYQDLKIAAEKNSVQVAPVHNYIHEPSVLRAKEMIESGKLGDLVPVFCIISTTLKKWLVSGVIDKSVTPCYCSL